MVALMVMVIMVIDLMVIEIMLVALIPDGDDGGGTGA